MLTATPPRGAEVAITERVASAPGRVDATRGIARNVKILGPDSGNGRRYTPACMKNAVGLYEGAKVNINHPDGDPLSPRSYADRFGQIRNVRYVEGRGLYGDLHFNPKHPMAEQFAHDAKHSPGSCGLSHNVLAKVGKRTSEGVQLVDAIHRVVGVDVVADPATNSSLFESRRQSNDVWALMERFQGTPADDAGTATIPGLAREESPVVSRKPAKTMATDSAVKTQIGLIVAEKALDDAEKLRRIKLLVSADPEKPMPTFEHRHAPANSHDLIQLLRG